MLKFTSSAVMLSVSCLVSTDVDSADKHRMQNPQCLKYKHYPAFPPAWIFAINHNQIDRLTPRPDAISVTPKKTCNINSQNQKKHPSDQGLTLKKGVEGGWFWIGGRVLKRQPPQLEADPHHQPQLTGLDRLALRTSLGSVVPPILLRSSTVKTLALSNSSKLPMLSMVTLDAALQETMFFMSFSWV